METKPQSPQRPQRASLDRRARSAERSVEAVYEPIDSAAPKLGVTANALRARCRRSRRREGASVVADLGGGIRAVKFGRTWRVTFPTAS
jgi:hypothetical protein